MSAIPADFEQRLPVWHALSDLFVDTELNDRDYQFIARRLQASMLPAAKIRRILVEEVGPAFFFNVVSVAGNWTGWPVESVREIMTEFFQHGPIVPAKPGYIEKIAADAWPRFVHVWNV